MAYENIETPLNLDGELKAPEKTPLPPSGRGVEHDDVQVDTDQKAQDDLEIEVKDDTPETDRGRRRRDPGAKPYDVSDDEISRYDESVQQRIKKLRYEYHEERRSKEEATRRENAALDFGRKLINENARLKAILEQGEKTLLAQARARAEAQMARANSALHEAYAAQDPAKIAQATQDLAQATAEKSQIETMPLQYDGAGKQAADDAKAAEQAFAPRPQPQGPDSRAVEWAERNQWFGKDRKMTFFARGVDSYLLQRGVNPKTQPDQYFAAIDAAMREEFPDYFAGGGGGQSTPRPPVTTPHVSKVAPVNRTPPAGVTQGGPKKVTLTASQVEIARRLGLDLKDYARQVAQES